MADAVRNKCAIVVSEALSIGLAMNAASVLSVTLGARVDNLVGDNVRDASGVQHAGIIYTPLPVLKESAEGLARIVEAVANDEDVFFVDFSSLAQSCKTYEEYIERMAGTQTAELEIVGVGIYGPKKKINKLVGSLPLLR
jgi:hypothetical protein